MSLMDNNTNFSLAQAVTATAPSTGTYDALQGLMLPTSGGTYAVPPPNIIGVNQTFFGEDLGLPVGRGKGAPIFMITSGPTAPAGATSLEIDVQGAVDNGGGAIAGLTFVPYIRTRAIPIAAIAASTRVATIAWPRREVGQGLPRFINLNYIVGGGPFTGLTLTADIGLGDDSANDTLGKFASNF